MKKTRYLSIFALLLVGLALSACSGRGFTPTSWPGITIHNESIYVANSANVFQINERGQETDRIPEEAERAVTYFAPPAFTEDGQMLVGGYNNTLYSYDLDSGVELWTHSNSDRFIASPLVIEDVIYAPNADGSIYALNMDGNDLWTFETEEAIWASPVTDGEKLYAVSMDHFLYAVNMRDGSLDWKLDLGGTMVSTPFLAEDGTLYTGTFSNQVIAVDTQAKTILWRFDTQGWVWGSPVVVNDVLYAGDLEGTLYALDAAAGSELWRYQGEGYVTGAPLVTEEHIYYVTELGNLYGLTLEGDVRFIESLGEEFKFHGSPVAFNDLILVTSAEAEPFLYAYNDNGQLQWDFTPNN